MRARLGRLLRRWADRIHPAGTSPTYHRTAYSYTAERTTSRNPLGVALHLEDRGCPLYILDEDWGRAYAEADTDWRSPHEKLADMLHQFGRNLEDAVRPAADTLATYWTDPRQQGSKPLHKPEEDQ